MICGGAVYAPCPPEHGTHTGQPDIGTATHGGTAFTGANLTVGIVLFDAAIMVAVVATALRRWRRA